MCLVVVRNMDLRAVSLSKTAFFNLAAAARVILLENQNWQPALGPLLAQPPLHQHLLTNRPDLRLSAHRRS